ncbi:MAG: hypothetical protein QXU52_01095 [Fervidicoccaceae archaeon]
MPLWPVSTKLRLALSSLSSQSVVVEREGKKIVVKDYNRPASLKWLIALLPPAARSYPFELDPSVRMERELSFFEDPPSGVGVPRILLVDRERNIVEREYVEGEPLSTDPRGRSRDLGAVLALVHSGGRCMGDTKLNNFIASGQTIYVVDCEQCLRECDNPGYRAWDLALSSVLLYYTKPTASLEDYEERLDSFLASYLERLSAERPSASRVLSTGLLSLLPPSHGLLAKRLLGSRLGAPP